MLGELANRSFTTGAYCIRMKQRRHYHQPSRHYRSRNWRGPRTSSVGSVALTAALLGAAGGAGWALSSPEQQTAALTAARKVAVTTGMMRERAPQDGDYWRGCDDARAAGTAPIYRGEPGYREGMDGDSDGIACEPYR